MIRSVSVKSAVKDALEIFQFDQWLRFYFVVQKGDDLWMEIPEATLEQIEKDHPSLHRFADLVNDSVLDYQRSQENVCAFVATRLDGQKYEGTVLPQVFDDANFKLEMYIFNVWMKMHESHLDEEVMDFNGWMEMYEGWKSLDEVREYREKLLASGTDPQTPACDTAQ
ncbi:MAG: hypothetical protein AB7E51_13570 [Pseudodesulfovibrio sp.]|jgi:hypothetical protein|uniref:Uncharacterized protein n=1 Tax=Pseudodesulfovibrio indicus TaxID=1716143 RepID=A0A126QSF1_9BACT|nr:hypothetical protein [Pseudodesulfovibrio indicus]AMK12677.1 hypothetical protein AWY79_16970 [Pseudodesulfovibrio indicus]TDT90994.1 hypothetical protein EDC59_102429 [Pseudodesulfovibrio indicus]